MALSSGSLRLGAAAKPEVGPVRLATYCDLLTLLFSPPVPTFTTAKFLPGSVAKIKN